METHPDPAKALSDGPNAWPLHRMRALLETLKELDASVKRAGFPEHELMALTPDPSRLHAALRRERGAAALTRISTPRSLDPSS